MQEIESIMGVRKKSIPQDRHLSYSESLVIPNGDPQDSFSYLPLIVREPAILLIKWLRPKGLKVCSYVEKYAKFKNQTLKKIGWYTKMLRATEYPGGRQFLKLALKWGTLYHRV